MIIKSHKKSFGLAIATIMTITIVFLTYDSSKLRLEKWALMADIMSVDLGISELPILSELGGYLTNNGFRAIINIVRGFPDRPLINRIDIDIKLLEYNKILADRQRGLDNNVSYYRQKVNAKIRYNNATYKAKIRLKGTSIDHWRAKARMSLRINLKGKNSIEGFKKFSIHKPGSRGFPYNHVFQKLMKELGGLGAVHKPIHVFVNGMDWGVMDMQEHISGEMLEKQGRKDSIVVYLGSRYLARYQRTASEIYKTYHLNDGHFILDVFSSKKYLKSPVYRKYFSYLAKESTKATRENIIDKRTFSKTLLAFMIWNNEHALNYQNCRFYFNPYILKLQPITADQGVVNPLKEYQPTLPELFLEALDVEEIIRQFHQASHSMTLSEENIEKIINNIGQYFPNSPRGDYLAAFDHLRQLKENPDRYVRGFVDRIPKEGSNLTLRAIGIKNTTSQVMSKKVSKDILTHVTVTHFDDGTLQIANLLNVKIDLIGVYLDGKKLEIDPVQVSPYELGKRPLIIDTKSKGIMDGRFSVVTSLLGYERTQISEYTLLKDSYNPLLEESKSLPSFVGLYEGGYKIKSGNWYLTHPLIIDGTLKIEPDTHLHFSKDSYLIVKGALIAEGRPDSPIRMGPTKDEWKGLYVVRSEKNSVLEYVNINQTTGLSDGALSLTGGVTFYQSDVSISHSVIDGSSAEDALNIVDSKFEIIESKIANTRSDGLDSDFSTGSISKSTFSDIGGDAIDFSGGINEIDDVRIQDVHDKGVSAGEGSRVNLSNIYMSRVGVGIASKDGSSVTADAINIKDYQIHAVMSYVKKDFYGPPSVEITRITHNGGNPFLRQKGSAMLIDGKKISQEKVDIKALYSNGVMRK
jgi:hypothetical protein